MFSQQLTKIFLVRHGQSIWNKEKRVTGQGDPPLSEKGEAQSQALAAVLGSQPLTAVYASTLTRAIATAKPTASRHDLPVRTEAALKEMHLGILQGRFRDARDPEAQRLWRERALEKWNYHTPGGETYCEFSQRVTSCLREILQRERGGNILIVGHRNTNRVLLGSLMQWAPDVTSALRLRSKYLYEIISHTNGSQIRTICLDDPHLGLTREGFYA